MQEHVIAKKYAKAIASICSAEEIMKAYDIYAAISQAFTIGKFREIVNSRIITNEKKLAFLHSLVDIKKSLHAERLLAILVRNDRISLLPFVMLELKKIIDSRLNVYQGVLYVKQALNETALLNIQNKLGKKLNVTLQITQKIDPGLDGIKLEVAELSIEVAFLKNKFTQELQDFILKAI